MPDGFIAPPLDVVQFDGQSVNFDNRNDPADWRPDLFGQYDDAGVLYGAMTYNDPIDFVHWTAGGNIGETGLEWWQQCLTLVMRHI